MHGEGHAGRAQFAVRPAALNLVVILAAIIGTVVDWSGWAHGSAANDPVASSGRHTADDHRSAQLLAPASAPPLGPIGSRRGASIEDGALPAGVTVFDDELPGVARLEPGLVRSLRDAATVAAADGTELVVTSGWRSPGYQEQLLQAAISEYGSADEAARWVATAATSPHVSGDAVDIGPPDAASWLAAHGSAYGLCQIYRNEPWHYELRPKAVGRACPPMYDDPTEDPRMEG